MTSDHKFEVHDAITERQKSINFECALVSYLEKSKTPILKVFDALFKIMIQTCAPKGLLIL